MPTLQEILENDMGLGSEKLASVEHSEIDRLASELGIDFGKEAEEKDDEEEEAEEEDGEEVKKTAGFSRTAIDNLYNDLFSDDSGHTEKTAELEKVAYEQNVGARSYDYFASQWDQRIEKLAEECMAHDGTPPQMFPNNKATNGGQPIDTKPLITDAVSAESGDHVVGHYEQKTAAILDAAIRKQILISQLED